MVFAKPVASARTDNAELTDVDDDLQGIEFRGTARAKELA